MTKHSDAIRLEYDHAAGAVVIILPSATRIACTKASGTLVYGLLNALHMLPKERLRIPLTQAEINQMAKSWMKNNVVTMPLVEAKGEVKLEDLGL
jgi:hypothetical protein